MKTLLWLSLVLALGAPALAEEIDPRIQGAFQEVLDSLDKTKYGPAMPAVKKLINKFPDPPKNRSEAEMLRYQNEWAAFAKVASGTPGGPLAFQVLDKVSKKLTTDERYMPPDGEGPNTDEDNKTDPNGNGTIPGGNADASLPNDLLFRKEMAKTNADMNPGDPTAQRDYGRIHFYQRNDASAALYLKRAMDAGDGSADTMAMYGRSVYHLGDYEEAYRSGRGALDIDPKNLEADALVKLAKGKVSTARVDQAIAKAGLSAPTLNALQQGAGGAFGDESRQAAMMQSAAGQLDPIEQAKRAEMAAQAARQAIVPPSKIQQSNAISKEAARAMGLGDYAGAYARASEAIALNNQNAQAWNYRAMAASNMQRYSDAVYDASYSISLEGKQAPPWVTRSWAFAKQGKYKEAEADARVALEKAPGNAYAYHDLAFALAGSGRREEALDALRRAAAADPRFKPKLEQALQLSQNDDMTLLFADAPAGGAGAPAAPTKKRWLRLILLSLSGGLIVALGVLHIVSASWREKVNATVRRVLGTGSAQAEGDAVAAVQPSSTLRTPVGGGTFWEQYELISELGAGGMGLVYEARDTGLDRHVAVKKMRDEIRIDPLERQRFVQEARMVAALHHPNIVEIYQIVEQDQDVFLVFEYVRGQTLGQRIHAAGALSFADARAVLRGVSSAVEYAHSRKIIHRDLKPSNIMITDEGQVKVMDFGVARQAKDAVTKMSMTNTVVGTPPYMAPEQEQGTVRMESDVFALGVVLYESLCGELPFVGVGAGMLLNKLNGKHEPLSKRGVQGLPPGLDDVIAKALVPDPDKRYRTPAELMAALDALTAAKTA